MDPQRAREDVRSLLAWRPILVDARVVGRIQHRQIFHWIAGYREKRGFTFLPQYLDGHGFIEQIVRRIF